MSARAAALLAAPLGVLASAVAPGSGCAVSRCCGMLGSSNLKRGFHNEQVGFMDESTRFCNKSGCNYSPACALLNVVPDLEKDGGLCNSSSSSNATIFDAIALDPNATSRLSSGRPLVSWFIEKGTCAEIEGVGCWSVPGGFAFHAWTNKLAGIASKWASDSKQCTPGLPTAGQPAWGIGCAADGTGLRVLAWLADANVSIANASHSKASSARMTAESVGEDWYARTCGLSVGLNFTIGAHDWNTSSTGFPRWRCFDVPRENSGSDPMRMLVQSVGELPCAVASKTTSTTSTAFTSESVRVGMTALAAVAAAAVARHFA